MTHDLDELAALKAYSAVLRGNVASQCVIDAANIDFDELATAILLADAGKLRHLRDARNTLVKTATGRIGSDELTIPRQWFDSVIRNLDAALGDA